MRRLSKSVAVLGAVTLLIAAGGAYAFASSGGGTITVCVKHKGGALYKAKKCKKHDKKVSWNQVGRRGPAGAAGAAGPPGAPGATGPQGPGATGLTYTVAGSASPTPATIGTVGPYTLVGKCTDTSGSDDFSITFSGPGTTVDGFSISSGTPPTAFPQSGMVSGPIVNGEFGDSGSSSSQAVQSGQLLLVPTGSTPLQLFITIVANGATPVEGSTPNTCHLAVTTVPVPSIVKAAAHAGTSTFSGPLLGKH